MASDGAEVDVIAPVTSGSIAPGKERAAFARAHEAIRDGRSPALVDVREVLVTSQDVHVVRAPLARETLADLSFTVRLRAHGQILVGPDQSPAQALALHTRKPAAPSVP